MAESNPINIVEIIDKLTDWKICLTICFSSAIMFYVIKKQILLLSNELYIFSTFFIFLMSLIMTIIKICIIVNNCIADKNDKKRVKIRRLNEIFKEIAQNSNGYMYFAERFLISTLYKYKLKEFTINELVSITDTSNPYYIQNLINKLCHGVYPLLENEILKVEKGKYKFYSCVWKELKEFYKNGLIKD